MTKKRITPRMKVDALLLRVFSQFGAYLKDPSGEDLKPGDPVVFDHVHARGLGGAHHYENLRPVLHRTNAVKAKREVRDMAHIKRLRGEGKLRKQRAIPSSAFPKSRTTNRAVNGVQR